MTKNYYLILGVTVDATADEIRAAYRGRAKALHPDRSGEGSGPFQEVQEAYTILSDPESRRLYDRSFGQDERRNIQVDPISPMATAKPFQENPNDVHGISLPGSFHAFEPSFEALFDRLWRNFSGLPGPKSEQAVPLHVEILLTPEEARLGGQIQIRIPARRTCPTCRGRGRMGFLWCMRCGGAGRVVQEYPLRIAYPPGIHGEHTVTVSLEHLSIDNFYLNARFRVL